MGNGASIGDDNAIIASALELYAKDPSRAEKLVKEIADKTGIDITKLSLGTNALAAGGEGATASTASAAKPTPANGKSTKPKPTPANGKSTKPKSTPANGKSTKPKPKKKTTGPPVGVGSRATSGMSPHMMDPKAQKLKNQWRKTYKLVDAHVKNFPLRDVTSTAELAKALTSRVVKKMKGKLNDPVVAQVCKLRACFKWMALNVAYDADAYYKGRTGKVKPEEVIKHRTTVCEGYASLFVDLATITVGEGVARSISGHAKGAGYTVGQSFKGTGPNHAWVECTLGGHNFLFDPTWGAGHVNNQKFVRKYCDHYWMTDPGLFVLTHRPKEDADQLLASPITMATFEDLAYFRPNFFRSGLLPHSANSKHDRVALSSGEKELTLRFGSFDNTKVTVTLLSVKENATTRTRTLTELSKGCTAVQHLHPQPLTVLVRPPKAGMDYIVRMYCRLATDEDATAYYWAADYSLKVEKGYSSPGGFPSTYANDFNALLLSPLVNPLRVGGTVTFSVKASGVEKVICTVPGGKGGKHNVRLEKQSGEADSLGRLLFEGSVTPKAAGKLVVAGQPKGSRSRNYIAQYKVVKR